MNSICKFFSPIFIVALHIQNHLIRQSAITILKAINVCVSFVLMCNLQLCNINSFSQIRFVLTFTVHIHSINIKMHSFSCQTQPSYQWVLQFAHHSHTSNKTYEFTWVCLCYKFVNSKSKTITERQKDRRKRKIKQIKMTIRFMACACAICIHLAIKIRNVFLMRERKPLFPPLLHDDNNEKKMKKELGQIHY